MERRRREAREGHQGRGEEEEGRRKRRDGEKEGGEYNNLAHERSAFVLSTHAENPHAH